MKSKLLSGIIAIGYLILSYCAVGSELTGHMAMFLILPLACIWFSDAMGRYTGLNLGASPPLTRTTPGSFVSFGGWLLLFLPVFLFLITFFISE